MIIFIPFFLFLSYKLGIICSVNQLPNQKKKKIEKNDTNCNKFKSIHRKKKDKSNQLHRHEMWMECVHCLFMVAKHIYMPGTKWERARSTIGEEAQSKGETHFSIYIYINRNIFSVLAGPWRFAIARFGQGPGPGVTHGFTFPYFHFLSFSFSSTLLIASSSFLSQPLSNV